MSVPPTAFALAQDEPCRLAEEGPASATAGEDARRTAAGTAALQLQSVSLFRSCSSLLVAKGQAHGWMVLAGTVHGLAVGVLPAMLLLRSTRDSIYNILWALVFAFATLNILGLGARRFEEARGLNFGEVLAILVVLVSIVLLGWEMLYVFHVLPIRLTPR